MAKKTVEEIFSEVDNEWVCPFTGKRFSRSDAAAIEQHKADVIAARKVEEEAKRKAKEQASIRNRGRSVKTVDGLVAWLNQYAQVNNISLGLFTVEPNMEVTSAEKLAKCSFSTSSVVIKFQDIKALSGDLKKINIRKVGNQYIHTLYESQLKEAITKAAKTKIPQKLDIDGIAALEEQFPQYRTNVDRIKKLAGEISSLRDQIRMLEKQNESIRSKFVGVDRVKIIFTKL